MEGVKCMFYSRLSYLMWLFERFKYFKEYISILGTSHVILLLFSLISSIFDTLHLFSEPTSAIKLYDRSNIFRVLKDTTGSLHSIWLWSSLIYSIEWKMVCSSSEMSDSLLYPKSSFLSVFNLNLGSLPLMLLYRRSIVVIKGSFLQYNISSPMYVILLLARRSSLNYGRFKSQMWSDISLNRRSKVLSLGSLDLINTLKEDILFLEMCRLRSSGKLKLVRIPSIWLFDSSMLVRLGSLERENPATFLIAQSFSIITSSLGKSNSGNVVSKGFL